MRAKNENLIEENTKFEEVRNQSLTNSHFKENGFESTSFLWQLIACYLSWLKHWNPETVHPLVMKITAHPKPFSLWFLASFKLGILFYQVFISVLAISFFQEFLFWIATILNKSFLIWLFVNFGSNFLQTLSVLRSSFHFYSLKVHCDKLFHDFLFLVATICYVVLSSVCLQNDPIGMWWMGFRHLLNRL